MAVRIAIAEEGALIPLQLQRDRAENLNPSLASALPALPPGQSGATTGNALGQITEGHVRMRPGQRGGLLWCLNPAAGNRGAFSYRCMWSVYSNLCARSRRLWRAGSAWEGWLVSHSQLHGINMEKQNPQLNHWKSTSWITFQYFAGFDRYHRAASRLASSILCTAPGNLLWHCV